MSWYCLRTQPKREHIAASHISARGWADVYAPRIHLFRKTRLGKKTFSEALFPGYIFASTEESKNFDTLRYTPGVREIVSCGRDPISVDDRIINQLREVYSADSPTFIERNTIRPGCTIEITDGCFQGNRAEVIATFPISSRIQILLHFLGREIQVSIPEDAAIATPN